MQNKIEIWKSVFGYEEMYEVSDSGNVRGVDRIVYRNSTPLRRSGKLMNFSYHHKGYKKVSLSKLEDGKTKQRAFFVHRLVALSFLKNQDDKPQVNHVDGNKLNNAVSNLEWVTNLENMQHAGRMQLNKKAHGSKHGMSKLTEIEVQQIKQLLNNTTDTHKKIAVKFHVNASTISDIKRGKIWKRVIA